MLELLEYGFVQRAFMAGAILALLAPLIGYFLVVRRYSLLADCLAHVSLAGVALGLITQINPVFTAMGVSSSTALLIEKLRQKNKLLGESLLALFLWAGLAGAVVLISLNQGFNIDLFSFLFGSITAVTPEDLQLIALLGLSLGVLFALFAKRLFLIALDEDLALVSGLNPSLYNYFLILAASITVSVTMRIVGVMLVGAMMVIPVLTALNLKVGFRQTLLWALFFSCASMTLGLCLSLVFDIVSGGAIILTALSFYLLSLTKRG